jgi:hypothetical protein
MKFAFIAQEVAFPVETMCRVLGVAVSEIPCKGRQQPTPAAFQENRSRVG